LVFHHPNISIILKNEPVDKLIKTVKTVIFYRLLFLLPPDKSGGELDIFF
jgi:hypothetical protein